MKKILLIYLFSVLGLSHAIVFAQTPNETRWTNTQQDRDACRGRDCRHDQVKRCNDSERCRPYKYKNKNQDCREHQNCFTRPKSAAKAVESTPKNPPNYLKHYSAPLRKD